VLIINVIGVTCFHEAHSHGHSHGCSGHGHGSSKHSKKHSVGHGHSHDHTSCDHDHRESNEGSDDEEHDSVDHNMRGVYLHMVADLLGSVGVITSSLIVKYTGWMIADPICSTIISLMILASSIPLITETGDLLLQGCPKGITSKMRKVTGRVQTLEHVLNVRKAQAWVTATAPHLQLVVTMQVLVEAVADEQDVLTKARALVMQAKLHGDEDRHPVIVIQVEKEQTTESLLPPAYAKSIIGAR